MIELTALTKKYGSFTAVDDVSLHVQKGEIFGLLGPNGAGKTTTIGMISTLLLPTSGKVLIEGEEIDRRRQDLKRKISVITQEYSMRQDMNMLEIMEYQGLLYHMSLKKIKEKTNELLEFADLIEFRKRTVRKLSGGMKRKLMICRALLTEPSIILLDEPTAGMDALSRRNMWSMLRKLNDKDLTIILTTHYMEEAQALCERVAFMDRGRIIDIDTPQNYINDLGEYAVDYREEGELNSRYFPDKDSAIEFLRTEPVSKESSLRNTNLEDVFVSKMAGKTWE